MCKERDIASGLSVHSMSEGFHNGSAIENNNCTPGISKPTATTALHPNQGFLMPQTPQGVLSQMALLGAANLEDSLLVQQQQNSIIAANHFQKPFNGTNFIKQENKQQVINEIAASLADVKASSEPLVITPASSFGDSGQPSPATSTTSITSQVLKMQAAADGQNDALPLLSSVNYNDGENQQDGPFNVRVPSNMSNLSIDDSFLGTMTGSSTIQTGSGSFDNLFDGDSNMAADYNVEGQQDLSLSPHSGFSIPESGNLTIVDQGMHITLSGGACMLAKYRSFACVMSSRVT